MIVGKNTYLKKSVELKGPKTQLSIYIFIYLVFYLIFILYLTILIDCPLLHK